ncbi:zinc finger protein 33B-like [Oppia nitens]|uniref:zinc finger protein 33B-like n=1 Tax=Oppia nitens TaxID=1686743 RepID=UPI0023DA22F9|nr:zinc finger protein 33B-like [Oppia nitens]
MNQSNDNIKHNTRLGSRKTQDISVTIDVNDVFEEVVKQNERLVKEIEFYEEVVNDLIINVKTCIVCQQNDVIEDRINRLETHLKSKTIIDNLVVVKSEYNDCDKKLETNVKTNKLQKSKKTNKRCVKEVTDSDNYNTYETNDNKDLDNSWTTNVKTNTLKKTKKNLNIAFKRNEKIILRDVDEVTDGDSNRQTVKSGKHMKSYSDEYAKQRQQLRDDTLTSDGSYQCQTCEYKSIKFPDFEAHVNRYHLKIKPYKCNICGEHYVGYDALRRHSRRHYTVGEGMDQLSDRRKSQIAKTLSKFQCKYCQMFIHCETALNRHVLRVHKNVKPSKTIPCDMCDKFYCNRHSLALHKRLHHGIGRSVPYHYCDWKGCQYKSLNISVLTVHKKRHLGIRDYVCDWPGCEYRTINKNTLNTHQIIHSNKYDYRCQWPGCDFCTKQEKLLKQHINRVHEDIPRTLSCHWPGCDKMFRFSNDLKKHMKLHNDPHLPCPQCNKLFKSKQYLDFHMQSHTGWRRVSCPVNGCNTRISSKSNVKSHLRVHHKDWSGNK